MKTTDKPILPLYQVEINDLLTSKQVTSRSFSPNPYLFIARQNAFQYAQLHLAKKEAHEALEIIIKLIEYDRTRVPNPNMVIATVFQGQFPVDTNPDVLTIDVTLTDEAFNTPKALWNSLGEMTLEYEYYVSYGHHPGFSFMILTLSSAQSSPQAKLKQPSPFNSFWMLSDGLPYAASLISSYNKHYADETGPFNMKPNYLLQA